VRETLRRALIHAVGWLFILLGLAGLVLPVLQGILFLLVGLLILSRESAFAHRILMRLRHRFPGVAAQLDAAGERSRALLQRLAANRHKE
jgi:uncharacterized membrane protein YbaN (DUF454 family)